MAQFIEGHDNNGQPITLVVHESRDGSEISLTIWEGAWKDATQKIGEFPLSAYDKRILANTLAFSVGCSDLVPDLPVLIEETEED